MSRSSSHIPSRLMRRVPVALAASLALMVPTVAASTALLSPAVAAASAPTGHAAAVKFGARVIFPKKNPVEKKKWWITLQAWKGARKLHASDRYEFLLGSQEVAHRPGIKFFGTGRDWLTFPPAAVGHTLTLRVLITSKYGTRHFDHTITTRK